MSVARAGPRRAVEGILAAQPPPDRIMAEGEATVYIVDDDAGVRESLALLLGLKGFRTESYAGAEEFIRDFRGSPGCLLLDIRMPGLGGLELQRLLSERGVRIPVVIITAHGDVAAARTALKGGAVDFLEKPLDHDLLVATVREALTRDAASRTASARHHLTQERLKTLTRREHEVMDFVVQGLHNREIAQKLGISARTVEVYKARVMQKLQARRVADLVRIVMDSDTVRR
jgi:two-component system, LuxR family, response regulator FixJ